jgi:hypothetical protein
MVLDAVWSGSYRGHLARGQACGGEAGDPPGSVVDGLNAVVLTECEIRGKASSLAVTWPAGATPAEFGATRRVTEELGVDIDKAAERVFGRGPDRLVLLLTRTMPWRRWRTTWRRGLRDPTLRSTRSWWERGREDKKGTLVIVQQLYGL